VKPGRDSHEKRQSEKFYVKHGRAAGVVLQSGEDSLPTWSLERGPRISPSKNFSNPASFPPISSKASAATNSAALPQKSISPSTRSEFQMFPGLGAHLRGAIPFLTRWNTWSAPTIDAKYGTIPAVLTLIWSFPALPIPASRLPAKHVLSCFVQYAP